MLIYVIIYSEVVQNGKWDIHTNVSDQFVEDINEAESAQRKMAEQLGIEYTVTGTDCMCLLNYVWDFIQEHKVDWTILLFSVENENEKIKILVWSAKCALETKAVEIMGVQHPISESQTRGRCVGTNLKEKVFESINI